jgi:hypothetical protein
MKMRSMAIVTAGVVAAAILAGCGPTDTPTGGSTTASKTPAAPASTTPAAVAVKDVSPGNCTLYTKADAVKLLGAVNMNNKALEIGTGGGTKIDVCSYLDFKGGTDLEGVSYAVVRYDSDATAATNVKKVKAEMLESAGEHSWPVDTLWTPVPGAGPVLGGYGTKNENGLAATIAVVGTNVGPYLVVALGASTESADRAKNFGLTLFKALTAAVS